MKPWHFDISRIRETSAFKALQEWLDEATNTPGLWALFGPAGSGKTYGLLAYAELHGIPYYQATGITTTTTLSKFLRSLLETVNATYDYYQDPFKQLCEWAATQEQPRLIIDEAARLTRSHFEALRDLTDFVPTSIILCGTHSLRAKLTYYDTIIYRIVGRFDMPLLTLEDIQNLTGLKNGAAYAIYSHTKGNICHVQRLVERIEGFPEEHITPELIAQLAKRYLLKAGEES